MSKLPQESRGFSNSTSGFKGFKNYIKTKEKSMSNCDDNDKLGNKMRYSESSRKPKSPLGRGGGPQMSKEEYQKVREALMDGPVNTPKLIQVLKDTNPKDSVGIRKSPISTVSTAVIAELGLAMLEGARKYGRHNYRVSGVRASVYWDALFRHLMAWWDFGQDIDPDSGLPHIVKAMACLCVLRDSQHINNWVDDRPPPLPIELLETFNRLAGEIIDRHPVAKDAFTCEDVKKS